MAKTRKELQAEFLANITYNARRFNMRRVGVPSLDQAAEKRWPGVKRLEEGVIYREPVVPMPKMNPVRDPEQIRKINEINDGPKHCTCSRILNYRVLE